MFFLQVILAVLLSWAVCGILTAAGVFPSDPDTLGYYARTDTKTDVIAKAAWIRIPYPCNTLHIPYNEVKRCNVQLISDI